LFSFELLFPAKSFLVWHTSIGADKNLAVLTRLITYIRLMSYKAY